MSPLIFANKLLHNCYITNDITFDYKVSLFTGFSGLGTDWNICKGLFTVTIKLTNIILCFDGSACANMLETIVKPQFPLYCKELTQICENFHLSN